MRWVLWSLFIVASGITVAVYNVIWVLVLIPFLLIILIYIFRSFIKALKETARLENLTNSPVLTHLGETILGASTIRAFNKTDIFIRNQFSLQDVNLNAMIINKSVR